MYTTHFGFDSKPFKPKDPSGFYRNASFDGACADILDGIRERRGFILLTGEAGLGKTFTLRRCMADAGDIRFVLLTNADLDFLDILNYLCTSLNLSAEHLDAEQRSQLLLDALAAHARRNQAVALLVDDAHHLRIGVLGRLWEFVVTPTIPNQRLQVVLAGLPEIEGKLRQPELRQLGESIVTRCRLDHLSGQEIGPFISHQFEVAGRKGKILLSPEVIDRIATYCQGVPRAIAMLCDVILLLASLESGRDITPELVDEAARNCFFGERAAGAQDVRRGAPSVEPLSVAAVEDAQFDLNSPELDITFDFELEETQVVERLLAETGTAMPEPTRAFPAEFPPSSAEARAPRLAEQVMSPPSADAPLPDRGARAGPDPFADPWEPALAAILSEAPPLNEFVRLLDELVAKQDRGNERDREALRYFRDRYPRLLRSGSPARLAKCERRIARLAETRQPVLVSLATALKASPAQDGVLCALLVNPTWWLHREIRLRLRSSDLVFANDGQIPPLRLLDGRDARPVYLSYRCPGTGPVRATLWLELDLRDHRGEWRAYNNRLEIRLDLSGRGEDERGPAGAEPSSDRFWRDPEGTDAEAGSWLLADDANGGVGGLVCTLPLELEANPERTHSLNAATDRSLDRGTPMTRALLLAADPALAPARIEIVSRPFMIFGRHGAAADTGFGDFTLGFVPRYNRISRLHCVICALGDQLALMPASDQGYTYTGRNGQRLERGRWEMLETDDTLDICDLYRLKLFLAWDRKWEGDPLDWNPQEPRDRFGHYLLDLVEVLKQRDQKGGGDELRAKLRSRYFNLLRMQDRVAELNGVGNPGSLLFARFERVDTARQQVVHYYVPKWLPLGSSPQAGLCINAEGVAPRHAELFFREGMYWIQNLAGPGAVRVGCHGLASNEVLALEAGDMLAIGAARFAFEAY